MVKLQSSIFRQRMQSPTADVTWSGVRGLEAGLPRPNPSDAPLPSPLIPLVSPDRPFSSYRVDPLKRGGCAETRAVALMSGQHPRLGEASLLVDLDELLLRQICDLSETRSLEVILQTPLTLSRLPMRLQHLETRPHAKDVFREKK